MKANREDVVQAALIVERWCRDHFEEDSVCDCPFGFLDIVGRHACALYALPIPLDWSLEKFLRGRGLRHD